MAIKKAITNPRTGVTADYWRVVSIAISAPEALARIVLGGYVSTAIRQGGGVYVDQRAYDLGPPQFAALAAAPPQGESVFGVIAGAAYQFIKAARRPVDAYDPETGEATLDGIVYPPDQVVNIGSSEQPVWTVPSEFADAEDV